MSQVIVSKLEIKKIKHTKDFSWSFYCTNIENQAKIWAKRKTGRGYLNIYSCTLNDSLKIKKFPIINKEWLDFIADCRHASTHDYDIIEGPMADDTIYNYVEDYLEGTISKEAFMQLAKLKKQCIKFLFILSRH